MGCWGWECPRATSCLASPGSTMPMSHSNKKTWEQAYGRDVRLQEEGARWEASYPAREHNADRLPALGRVGTRAEVGPALLPAARTQQQRPAGPGNEAHLQTGREVKVGRDHGRRGTARAAEGGVNSSNVKTTAVRPLAQEGGTQRVERPEVQHPPRAGSSRGLHNSSLSMQALRSEERAGPSNMALLRVPEGLPGTGLQPSQLTRVPIVWLSFSQLPAILSSPGSAGMCTYGSEEGP